MPLNVTVYPLASVLDLPYDEAPQVERVWTGRVLCASGQGAGAKWHRCPVPTS